MNYCNIKRPKNNNAETIFYKMPGNHTVPILMIKIITNILKENIIFHNIV